MIQAARLLVPCLWLAACQSTPPETPDWAVFLDQVERMEETQLQLARESAMRQYSAQANDANRLRAGYVLSRLGRIPAVGEGVAAFSIRSRCCCFSRARSCSRIRQASPRSVANRASAIDAISASSLPGARKYPY